MSEYSAEVVRGLLSDVLSNGPCLICGSLTDCTCWQCGGCDEWYQENAKHQCSVCEACEDCCACWYCEGCSESKAEDAWKCDNCKECERCCTCWVCESCDRRRSSDDYSCESCEYCERCCDCYYCEGCSERHHSSTNYCSDCERCMDTCTCESEEENARVYDYGVNPLRYLSFQGKPEGDGKLFLGVELEVEVHGDYSEKAEQWNNAGEDWLILKRDGSLNHGFEIVTAPSSLAVHKEKWSQLLAPAGMRRGMKSWNTSTCGLHVHVSREALSQLTLGKLLVFLNSTSTHGKIVQLAGRDYNHYCKYTEKKVTQARKYPTDRYEALNLCNGSTVEFRIFKGTLLLQHVLANVEFCDAVCRWARDVSIRDCESWASFWAYVEKNRKVYSNLIGYMSSRVTEEDSSLTL